MLQQNKQQYPFFLKTIIENCLSCQLKQKSGCYTRSEFHFFLAKKSKHFIRSDFVFVSESQGRLDATCFCKEACGDEYVSLANCVRSRLSAASHICYIYTYYIIEGVSRPYIIVYIIWSNWAFEVSMKCWVLVRISSILKHLRRVSHEFFIRVFVRYFLLHHLSHEKRQALLSTESWLFNRDPYNGLQL